ncbi:MAG TPA: serine/threonine-protein kinase [Gemmatales bacterium]|nr:serine/threonine-protein kinase [Gemmatales bacterium]
MNTPVDNKIPHITPITTDTVGRGLSADQPTVEHQIMQLDHLFPEKFGQYRVLKLIGKGGMGSVYLAEDPVLQRKVAIKTLRPELANHEVSKQRFFREAILVSNLKHEHIVTIYNVGEEYGIPYLAMEYLEGQSLEEFLQKKKKLTWAQIMRLGREIARALAVAHAKELIHRDVKPANIWLEVLDKKTGKIRVKLLDFGLARYSQQISGVTEAGMVVGTPHYVSPEQARGKEVDARSDLFSLGVVLYRLCTRVYPFDGPDTLALLTSLAVDTPLPMRHHNPDVPEALDLYVLKLLSREPADRPASAKLAAEELSRIYHAELERQGVTDHSGKLPALKSRVPFLEQEGKKPEVIKKENPWLYVLLVLIAISVLCLVILLLIKWL